jgi:hypothetical protein
MRENPLRREVRRSFLARGVSVKAITTVQRRKLEAGAAQSYPIRQPAFPNHGLKALPLSLE